MPHIEGWRTPGQRASAIHTDLHCIVLERSRQRQGVEPERVDRELHDREWVCGFCSGEWEPGRASGGIAQKLSRMDPDEIP